MKNNTSFNDDQIDKIVSDLDHENEFSLTKRQVINIARRVDEYSFNDEEDKILALEYACKIRNEISNYINFCVHNNALKKYYYCNTIDYAINRVLSIISNEDVEIIYNNAKLERKLLFIEYNLRQIVNKKTNKTLTLKAN